MIDSHAALPFVACSRQRNIIDDLLTRFAARRVRIKRPAKTSLADDLYLWTNYVTCTRDGAARARLKSRIIDQLWRHDRDSGAGKLVVLCVSAPTRRSVAENIRVEGVAALTQIREGE